MGAAGAVPVVHSGTSNPSCTPCRCSAGLFGGPAYGPSILLAAVVLAIMTLPTLVSLSRTALRAVPVADREAAMALGATRWQVVRKVVWPAARPGIAAAVTLAIGPGLGRGDRRRAGDRQRTVSGRIRWSDRAPRLAPRL